MKERPILFTSEMVRAILDGRKTQTRRILKFPETGNPPDETRGFVFKPEYYTHPCPYGQPGDRLWVRETFTLTQFNKPVYRSDARDKDGYRWSSIEIGDPKNEVKWKPSIYMPRWASRITLEITSVRVERLKDITQEGAEKEGWPCLVGSAFPEDFKEGISGNGQRTWFRKLWNKINGPGAWEKNPWVWVIEFKKEGQMKLPLSTLIVMPERKEQETRISPNMTEVFKENRGYNAALEEIGGIEIEVDEEKLAKLLCDYANNYGAGESALRHEIGDPIDIAKAISSALPGILKVVK